MKIEKDSELYSAIGNAVDYIFNGEIPLNEPSETLKMIVEVINNNLEG